MSEANLDATSQRILRILERDARTDPKQIAIMLGLTADEVERRIQQAEAMGALVRHKAVVNWELAGDPFVPREEADGHWVTREEVVPLSVDAVGDLLMRHAEAGIELRITPSLWPLHDAVLNTGLRFSMVRMRNALPRTVL